MADVGPDREAFAEFKRIAQDLERLGVPRRQAMERAKARVAAGHPAPNVSGTESALRGAGQGASMGFGDELLGAFGAHAISESRGIPEQNPIESYRAIRDRDRASNQAAQEANPKTYLAGQIAGGVATAPIVPAASTVKGAAALGAGLGAAAGLGESDADLTRGDVSGAAVDTIKGAVAGGVLGAGAHAVAKGAGVVAQKVRGTREATKAAGEVVDKAELPSMIGRGETIRTATEKAKAITDEASAMLGEPYRLRPSQVTGDPALALKESKAAQFPSTMLRAQAEEAKRLEQSARVLDMYVDGIASNPAKLGRADVGDQLTGVVQRHLQNLKDARSTVGRAMYDRAERLLGDTVFDTHPVVAAIQDEISRLPANGAPAATKLQKTLEALTVKGDSIAAFGKLRAEQSYWSDLGKQTGTILEGLPDANARRIAGRISDAIQESLDNAAANGAGEGIDALRAANKAWAQHTAAIKDAGTETVQRILKVGATDAADKLSTRLMNSSPEEVSGVFRVLNKADPAAAQQLRAQLFEEVLAKGGKPSRAAPEAAASGVAKLNPRSTISSLEKNEPMLQAAFEGDPKAKLALSKAFKLLQRLDFGPNIRGSQTAPLMAQDAIETTGMDMAATAAFGPQGGGIMRGIRAFLTNEKAKAEALTSPQGIDDFSQILEGALAAKEGRRLPDEVARAVATALTRYTIAETKRDEKPQPGYARRGAY